MLSFIKLINNIIWDFPMLVILLGTHIFFSFRLGFIQKKIIKAIHLSVKPDSTGKGEVSSFASLATTLAATLGTGNIIGVSTAVALGGPGAVFWCWITGILGMSTTYAECYLGIVFRKKNKDGSYLGGPMYVIENGLKKKGLAILYALATLAASFGVGCTTQANSITVTTSSLWNWSPYIVGFSVALLTGLVIIGGIKKIGRVCTMLVPSMGAFYIIGCIILLCFNYNYIVEAISLIFHTAFVPKAFTGGLVGTGIRAAARYGIARGLFTNEAGLGSAAIVAASAKTTSASRQALISMTATFWDTVVMCAITGIVIITNILHFPSSIKGVSSAELTTAAFSQIPYIGEPMLGISLMAFAIATLIGWSFFGEKAVEYLVGKQGIKYYHVCYIVMIFIGSIMSLDLVWELSDFINAFMAVPNLLSLLLLYKMIKKP